MKPKLSSRGSGVTSRQKTGRLVMALVSLLVAVSVRGRAQSSLAGGTTDLSLQEFLSRVLERNESLQGRLLEFEANRRKAKGEWGAFEPDAFGSYSREANRRQNTVVEQSSMSGAALFDELNNLYQGGVEGLVPTGARIRLGYTLRDLRNNLQSTVYSYRGATNGEFQSFAGMTLAQPLLKNAWYPATMAGVRMAALASDIAFQDYRKQLMVIVTTAEATYWNLFMAQEQVRFFQESVETAQKILEDNRARLLAGKSSELEVLEAGAGLALRKSRLADAEQKLLEAASKLISLYSETVTSTNKLVRACDTPRVSDVPAAFLQLWQSAYENNPDYRMQQQKVLQEYVRVGYARNQRLPQLDLKGSYGLNGLGATPAASHDDLATAGFPSWSIGVELRVPLAGGIKEANDLTAARLRQKQALLSLKEIETQMVNGIDTAVHKVQSSKDSVVNYQTVTNFNQALLDSALGRLEVGKIDSMKVLQIESDLFEAKNSLAEAMVNYERAQLEMQFLDGSLLKRRRIDFTQRELEQRTVKLVRWARGHEEAYQEFINDLHEEYYRRMVGRSPAGGTESEASSWLKRDAELDRELTRALRERMKELKP